MVATTTDRHDQAPPHMPWGDRWHVWLAAFGHRRTGFTGMSRFQFAGHVERGRQMLEGRFLFHGHVIDAPDTAIWDLPLPDAAAAADLHGFGWLDDLAAAGDAQAEALAREWTWQWLERFGRGCGPGWEVALTGRRLTRWVDHADLVTGRADARRSRHLSRSLAQQVIYLSRRWRRAAPGLPRFETLAGWLRAALALTAMEAQAAAAMRALAAECTERIGADGGIPERNPEELLAIFALLTSSMTVLESAAMDVPMPVRAAVEAMAPVLRTLRHADGGLARFHGGGRGDPGRLDLALALSRVKPGPPGDRAMGFARLSHGRTTVIVDAAAPPGRAAAAEAHASALAFELTSGRRPLIVNCGSGRPFGKRWQRACRGTPAHSTLAIDGHPPDRRDDPASHRGDGPDPQIERSCDVRIEWRRTDRSTGLAAGHDGYVATYGLTHMRELHLDNHGRSLHGEDMLVTVERSDRPIFDRALAASGSWGVPFSVRFHLHPDVTADLDPPGQSVALRLKSGELWSFRHEGPATLDLEPSVHLDSGASEPRFGKQIVMTAIATKYATRIRWTLAKDRQTPDAVRDIVHDDMPVLF